MNPRLTLSAAAVAAFVAACGGGGHDDGIPSGGGSWNGPPAAQAFDVSAALGSILSRGAAFPTMRASLQGVDFGATVTYQPAADAPFRGVVYKLSNRTVTMTSSVAPSLTARDSIFYTLNPTRLTGYIGQDGLPGHLQLIGDLPTAALVGQSGPYLRATAYAADGQTVLGQNWVTWSLETDSATTALACLSWAYDDGRVYTKDCLRTDPSGHVSGATMTMYYDFGTLEFK